MNIPGMLSENARLVFAGVRVPAGRRVPARWRAPGPAAGPEWLRPWIGATRWRAGGTTRWIVDFAPGVEADEAARTGAAWRRFRRSGGRLAHRGAGAELRIALAKHDRYFAAAAKTWHPHWRWLDAGVLPGSGLVAVVRDDEFLAGVLASRWLEVWLRGLECRLGVKILRCFPFPWPPDAPRGALTTAQEEQRAAVIGHFRSGEAATAGRPAMAASELDRAVAIAYGWPRDTSENEAFIRLAALNQHRCRR